MPDHDPLEATADFSEVGAGDATQAYRDELFGQFAVLTRFVDQETLARVTRERGTDTTKSLAEVLVETGVIADTVRQGIDLLVNVRIAKHGSDPAEPNLLCNVVAVVQITSR